MGDKRLSESTIPEYAKKLIVMRTNSYASLFIDNKYKHERQLMLSELQFDILRHNMTSCDNVR